VAPRKRLRRAAALALAVGIIYLGQGSYIYLKAQLAQLLIERAWQRALAGEPAPRPWPWADTWPVARLEAPGQGVSLFVLSGSSGRTLAFGPGHEQGTPAPGARGNSVIGGHRDTHLAFLEKMHLGDSIRVQRADGVHIHYRVTQLDVLDKRDTWVTRNDAGTRLTLITCWPFDALRAGGDERYVVIAESDAVAPRSSHTSLTAGPSSLAPTAKPRRRARSSIDLFSASTWPSMRFRPRARASRMSTFMMPAASPVPRHSSATMTANSPDSRSSALMQRPPPAMVGVAASPVTATNARSRSASVRTARSIIAGVGLMDEKKRLWSVSAESRSSAVRNASASSGRISRIVALRPSRNVMRSGAKSLPVDSRFGVRSMLRP
jgi:sortase A